MTNQQLGWANVALLVIYFVYYFTLNGAPQGGGGEILACAWLGVSVWTAVRLINIK